MKIYLNILLFLFLSGCKGKVNISVKDPGTSSDATRPSVVINQAISETVGTCSFSEASDPTNVAGFSYRVKFSKSIKASTFTTSDVNNSGTGGASGLSWEMSNCGDDTNFKLTATSISGDGTIIPQIQSDIVEDSSGNKNTLYSGTDNSVTYDTAAFSLTINQATTETVGTCNFTTPNDPANSAGMNYRVTFSESINATTFTTADVINAGSGGGGGLTWSLANCGDDKNFKLVATSLSGDGTIVPQILSGQIENVVGNVNSASTSTDNSVTYDTSGPSVTINQATTQTVGSCSFSAPNDPANASGISYRLTYSEAINSSTFTTSDISNAGSGGGVALTWSLTNCGDDKNFKLVASAITGEGTIIPELAASRIQDIAGNNNSLSTSTDSSVTYDSIAPGIIINQATTETVGSCSFSAASDPANAAGFSYKLTFSEAINTSTLVTSDITNAGTGGSTALVWTIINCGDNTNYKLTTISVVGDGTIIPQILGSQIQDVAGNNNSPSTSTDNSMTYDSTAPGVAINQATTESVGSCSFTAPSDPTNASTIAFKVAFSEPINASSFTTADIINGGAGGSSALTWTITNCGDDRYFKLVASGISGDGAIVPQILSNTVIDASGNNNTLYSSTDNSVTYDTSGPSVTINQATTQTVGSCSFSAVGDPTDTAGFSFRVTFSEAINASTFTTGDITNAGTGGGTVLNWSLTNCGDDKNYKLTAAGITGNGTIIPELAATKVQDPTGNENSLYTSTDNTVTFESLGWAQEAYIKAVNGETDDVFGSSLSVSGDTLAVGSYLEDSNQTTITIGTSASADNSLSGSGAVYIYKRSGFNWTQEAYIKAVNGGVDDNFGSSVSLSGDTLAVGALGEDSAQTTITNGTSASSDNLSLGSGAVYIYKRTGVNWTQEAYIKASNSNTNDNFGASVSISGETLAVGATGEDNNQSIITNGSSAPYGTGSSNSGAIYIYKRLGTSWTQEAYIKTTNNGAGDIIGNNVSLSGDNLAVGSNQEDSNQTTITNGLEASSDNSNSNSGAVYIYKRVGVSWAQEAYIKAVNNNALDNFSNAISLSGDTLAVGSYQEDSIQTTITNGTSASSDNSASASGAVYIYKRTGSSWGQEAYIKAVNNHSSFYFGSSVSLSGNTLGVGVYNESSDQNTITNGSTASSNVLSGSSGAVYVYKRIGTNWSQEAYIKAVNNGVNDNFGFSLSVSGDTIAVGAYGEDSSQTTITNGASASSDNSSSSSGAVYVYRNNARPFDPVELRVSTFGSSSLTLAWQAPGFRVSGYKIAYSLGSTPPADCSSGTVIDVGNVLSYSLTGLTAGTFYSFRICTYDSGDAVSGGQTSTFQTLFSVPDLSNLSYTPQGTFVDLSWTSGGGSTAGFKIAYSLSTPPSNCSSGTVVDVGNVATYQLTGLSPQTTYGMRVCAYDSSANTTNGDYVYATTIQSGWNQEAYIKASNGENADGIGMMTSLSGDTLAVGIYYEDSNQTTITNGATGSSDNSSANSGAVYVFKRNGAIWSQEAFIKAANSDAGDSFGYSVSVSGDTLAVGANVEKSNQTTITNGVTASSDNSLTNAGAAYVYKRSGASWAQEAYIKSVNTQSNHFMGSSIAINGETLAVGARGDCSNQTTITNGASGNSDCSNITSGAIFIYKRSGVTWSQEAYIKASNNEAWDQLGEGSIALSADTLAVGVYQEDSNQTTITNGATASSDNSNTDSGAVYIYKRSGISWSQEAYIKAVNNGAGDYFGNSVSLSGDTLAVGTYREDSNQTTLTNGSTASSDNSSADSGAVYVYKRSGSTWTQEAYLKAVNSESGDYFGYKVSLSGNTLAVGSYSEDSNQSTITNGATASTDNTKSGSGAVFIYKRSGASWVQEAYIKAVNLDNSDTCGASVSLSGDTVAVGCAGEDSSQTTITNGLSASLNNGGSDIGAIYIYRNNARLFDPAEFSASSVSSQGITLNWKSAGLLATGYKIAYAQGGVAPADCSSGTVINVGNVTSYSISGLGQDTQYSFRICSYDSVGTTAQGYTTTFKTIPVPQPIALSAYSDSGSSITVNWTSGEGVTTGFKIAYAVTTAPASCSLGTVIDVGNVTSFQVTGLTAATLYGFRVCTYDALGSMSLGQITSARTGEVPWNQEAYIKAANNTGYDYFGSAVSLSGDTLAVGVYLEDSNQTTITNGTGASSNNTNSDSGAVYIYKRTGVNWAQEAYVKAVNNGNGDYFGFSVSLSGDTLAVGAYLESSNQTTITNGTTASSDNTNTNSGAVYVYKRSGAIWDQEAYIKAENNNSSDYFGYSVSINENTLAIGAYQEDSNQTTITNGTTASTDNSTSNSGAVYIYKRTGSTWVQEAYIKAVNNGSTDFFGFSVSLNGDTLAVGAYQEDSNQTSITNGTTASTNNSNSNSGAIYIYKRTGSNWTQEAFIKAANNSGTNDEFGRSNSLYGDLLAVGVYKEDSNQTTITNGLSASSNNNNGDSGAVYIYSRSGTTWAQEAYIKAVNNNTNDWFGFSISLSGDTLAVGAQVEDSNQTTITNGATASSDNSMNASGAVYVYKRSETGWFQEAYIKAANNDTADDRFGNSVSISGDSLAVGAYYEDNSQTTITNGTTITSNDSSFNSGAVYIYRNRTRLFEVSEIWGTSDSSSVTLTWNKSGGSSAGYYYSYQAGLTAPSDCQSGTWLDVGDVSTASITGLSANTTYTFRLCAYEDGSTFTDGFTKSVTTLP